MYNFFRQNKHILFVSLAVFIVSMTMLMVFLNTENKEGSELTANVMNTGSETEKGEETKYRDLFQNQEDPVLVLGLDGKIGFASKDVEDATGYTETDMVKTLFSSYIHPDDLPVFFAAFGKAIATGKAETMIGPFRVRDMNGEYKYNMGSVYPVMEDNKVAGVGMTIKDITDHLDQYIQPQVEEPVVAEPVIEPEAVVQPEEEVPAVPVKKYQPIKHKTYVKPSTTVKEQPAAEPAPWKKPSKLKSDPNWITGEKIVMWMPF